MFFLWLLHANLSFVFIMCRLRKHLTLTVFEKQGVHYDFVQVTEACYVKERPLKQEWRNTKINCRLTLNV